MRVVLAPMEGVLDPPMRSMLTAIGGFDHAVTEFVRVNDLVLPDRVFYLLAPELKQGGVSDCGTPVRVQLLGSNADMLAANAQRAVALGSPGIDLNFGCPAKTVNRSRGGAILLNEPEVIYQIVKKVRQAVPSDVLVSAKMRLGYESWDQAVENACAIESAGANELAIHARTKVQGYKPPAYWSWIKDIKQHVTIPIIANGEIWNQKDALNCQEQSGIDDIMIGRGAVAMPNLARVVKGEKPFEWPSVVELLLQYSQFQKSTEIRGYYPSRIKQWLKYLSLTYPQATPLFERVKRCKDYQQMIDLILTTEYEDQI